MATDFDRQVAGQQIDCLKRHIKTKRMGNMPLDWELTYVSF